MNNIIIKFSLCIKVWRVFKLKTDDIDDGGQRKLSLMDNSLAHRTAIFINGIEYRANHSFMCWFRSICEMLRSMCGGCC